MNDFKSEPDEIKEATLLAVQRVIESGWYVLGKEVAAFESDWAITCGTKFAVGVGNGMDAIEIILRTLELGPGDEVITTGMTAFATVLAILRAGATPVLADINPDTGLLSIDSVRRSFSPKTRAVILVHLYGQIRDMDKWVSFCEKNDVHLIEDCAQAHAANWKGKVAGSFGIAGAYSFYPTKNLGAYGDGGMIVTSDETVKNQANVIRNYGQTTRYIHPKVGMNSRLDELQAAILSVRHRWLDSNTLTRQKIAEFYLNGISNEFVEKLAKPQEKASHVYHLFVLKSRYRNELQYHLEKNGIQSLIHYPVPIHHQKSIDNIKYDPVGLQQTEIYAEECISIPCHPQLSMSEICAVINAVNSFRIE